MFRLSGRGKLAVTCLISVTAAINAHAQQFKTLVTFDESNGSTPYFTSLIQGSDGDLYGTTALGGINRHGTVFKITTDGTLTVLYSFTGGTDGDGPYAGLLLGSDGNFYGTTVGGGTYRYGTIFRITLQGKLKTLHSLALSDGVDPYAPLVQGSDGSLYGTATAGGANAHGTIFKITPAGTFIVLHSFEGVDGNQPTSGLVQATDGNFYGTTYQGGPDNGHHGTVFKMTPDGVVNSLHSFDYTDGAFPQAGLIQDSDGNFYGTTQQGGNLSCNAPYGCGTVFRITPDGVVTTLYSFCSQSKCTDGFFPYAGVIKGADGSFYGTTAFGGGHILANGGTLFRLTSDGVLTTLHRFAISGDVPYGGLFQDVSGEVFGTTTYGGNSGCGFCGTIFRMNFGLGSVF
ncbi:MAG: hypothetical protein LAO09_21345 [Acidobacteriia bacterium]|nr:hypothetical protein [Terriglobia bacterium]